jgi:putative intracellular protease/amidase
MPPTAHLALFDTLADWEVGHLLAELRTGRFTGQAFDVVTVAESLDPITTMGGVRMLPDALVSTFDPTDSDLLILPGGEIWDSGRAGAFTDAASRALDAGVPVAAICGAVFGLASVGLLDDRDHTGADLGYLSASGYAGGERYVAARAVVGGDVITAGPSSPVQFARATLEHLGVLPAGVAEAYEAVFHGEDASAYPTLMAAAS